ncbi:TIGR04066 family peptide maturation system protein [Paenibacillus sp. CAA11]|uniref:TIGR04066 family peptide maturation system protein n=1 Tax=Paenibacillus sp. CAA11 TaxID=1532905 RepID=UPI00131F285D|nr:TIGR04066 family peptide maturation system protein [Paenibacillus sp. CAA11]
MTNERLMIFPVDGEYLPFLKYSDLLERKSSVACYAPKGWFYVNKTISVYDKRTLTVKDISECTDFSEFDTVWIVNSNGEIDFSSTILPIIEQAAKEKKTIRITRALTAEEYYECSQLCKTYGTLIESQEREPASPDYTPTILRIQTPIVFVFGMFEHTEKLDTILYLHQGIGQAGYKVKTILTRKNETDLDELISFPNFMQAKQYSVTDKIFLFNHFIRRLELEEKPDIMIIGLPGEMMPLDERHNGNFGVFPYIISNAVHCDYAVMKLFHNFYDQSFADQLQEIAKYKFEIDINAFAVSNSLIDAASISTSALRFYVSEKRPAQLPRNFYFDHTDNSGNSLCEHLIETLQMLGNYIAI